MLRVVWLWYESFVKDFRSGLGLPALGPGDFARALRSSPMVGAYSRHVIPRPADWPGSVCVAGYFFLEEPTGWQPPGELSEFLEAGDPPVYVGFGSMAGDDPWRACELVLEAIAESGRRGLILSGWGGLKAADVPDDVFVLDSAPHGWLFPRMAAVVHHGGAGTTAEGVRAGLPSVILPFAFDQAFWGARLRAMGVGPSPIPQKRLSPAKLAEAIRIATGDTAMRRRADALGRAVREERGVDTAVEFLGSRLESLARGPGKGIR
jgi:sterol 3beta-glucosyltransferase